MKINEQTIEKLEETFGKPFAKWQKDFLLDFADYNPPRNGKHDSRMLVLAIRLLLCDIKKPINVYDLSHYVRDYVLKVNDILVKAGWETNLEV